MAAYAALAGKPVEEFLAPEEPVLTPQIAGDAVVELARTDTADLAASYLLSGKGLQKLP